MTFEEFDEIVCATFSKLHTSHAATFREWYHGDCEQYILEWVIDGSSGGNCWNDQRSTWHSGDPEPELDLDDLFEKLCPNMTFSQHRRITGTVERHDRHEREYYGNYTNYGVKKVSYRRLYDVLVAEGIITND